MSQYTSYFLYQKYVKYGDQGWLPVYPNVYSADGDGTMSVSAKTENDPACGYVPSGTDDYNYSKWESASSYICEDTTKYARERLYVSDDNINWIPTDIYRRSTTVLEYNSTDCGYDQQWDNYNCIKWEASGTICNEGNKYERLRKYFRQCVDCEDCSTEWFASNIYKQGEIIEYNSTDCGFVHGEKEYRWVNLDINYNWICDDCPSDPTITINRWINLDPSVDYYCSGTTKYYKQEKQTSNDRGVTWENTGIYRSGDVAESYSIDCDVVGPKFVSNYSNQTTYAIPCDDSVSTTLTSGDTRPSGYSFNTMTSAVVGDCVTSIGNRVFSGCSSLSSCTIGSGVTSIGTSAFTYCSSLTSIDIPDSVTSIGSSAFARCNNLTSITLSDNITSISNGLFTGCSRLTSVNIPNSVTSIGQTAFWNCSSISSVTLPDSVTTISLEAFGGCESLTAINIPSGVTSIGGGAFQNCYSLTSITIPSGVTMINEDTFLECRSLTAINIPSGVTTMGHGAFLNCTGLTSIVLPSSVTSIGMMILYGCTGLSSITIEATTPPTLGDSAFNMTNNCQIYVPAGSVDTYKSASGWSDYSSRIQAIP